MLVFRGCCCDIFAEDPGSTMWRHQPLPWIKSGPYRLPGSKSRTVIQGFLPMTWQTPKKPVHFNQIFHFHTEPPCSNKIHPPTKMAGKQTTKTSTEDVLVVWVITGEKKRVIHTMFIPPPRFERNLFFSSYISHHLHLFLEKKMHGTYPNNKNHRQTTHPQIQGVRVPFLQELLRFLAAYRAVEGFTREEWICGGKWGVKSLSFFWGGEGLGVGF